MMHIISRKYSFSAAHRIEGHPKCGRLHGHNYEVTVILKDTRLPESGMLMDYGYLDKLVKPIIDALDHRYIVSESNEVSADPYAAVAIMRDDAFILPAKASTAEHIAEYLHDAIARVIDLPATFIAVEVSESPKSMARFDLE
jgi:6-pyruvoyltetrahydropterin/6-carboxytetrahydropterin synthase